jgi:membrane protein YqaA with SNARE-associated domain
MLRKSYDWVMSLAGSRHAPVFLGMVAFAEGVFFPIPPDVLLAPVVLARRDRAFAYAALTTVCSILGGSTGYAVGYFLHPVGQWLLSLTGHADAMAQFSHWYGQWGPLMIALPIPYKLTAIASGMARMDFPVFIGVSILVRGLRFTLVATLIRTYGAPIQAFVEKRLALVASAVAVAIIAVIVAIKLLG